MVRRLQYTVPVFNPLGPPSTICHIKQKILKKGAGFVVVNAIHETPGVPGGGCFHISLQITMTQVSETKSRMYSSYELVFTKSTFYKTPIELATPSAMKVTKFNCRIITSCLLMHFWNLRRLTPISQLKLRQLRKRMMSHRYTSRLPKNLMYITLQRRLLQGCP